jgi:hypothetical protein
VPTVAPTIVFVDVEENEKLISTIGAAVKVGDG